MGKMFNWSGLKSEGGKRIVEIVCLEYVCEKEQRNGGGARGVLWGLEFFKREILWFFILMGIFR